MRLNPTWTTCREFCNPQPKTNDCASLDNRGGGPSVYLVDTASALVLRPVTVASFTDDAAIVTSGISNGDEVVTLGVQKLNPGVKVRIVDAR